MEHHDFLAEEIAFMMGNVLRQTGSNRLQFEDVMLLHAVAADERTPDWIKGMAFTALANFIMPDNELPDGEEMVMEALSEIESYITDEHRTKANKWNSDLRTSGDLLHTGGLKP